MANTRSTNLFWGDILTDPGLALCSLAAQGLWLGRLLPRCGLADRHGYLELDEKPLTLVEICELSGQPPDVVAPLLSELESRKVFSRDRRGCIYNRRMVRDAAKLSADSPRHQENGRKGGNPNLQRGTVPKDERARPYRRTDSPVKTLRIFEKTGGRCHWCDCVLLWDGKGGEPELFHVDHLTPIRDGGDNSDSNLVPSCAGCNHDRAKIGETVTSSKYNEFSADNNPDNKPRARVPSPLPIQEEDKKEKEVSAVSPPSAPLGNGVELSGNSGQLKMPDIPLHQVRPENGDWSFALFRQGLAWLSGATQQTPAQLRPLVGRWLKQFGDDHRGLFDLMAIAQRNAVADPRAWISAHLPKGQKNGHATGNRGAAAWANFALTGSVEGSDPDPVPE